MISNNRKAVIYETAMDKARRAKERILASKAVEGNRYEAIKDDIIKAAELVHREKEYVKDAEHIIINKNTWKKKINKGDSSEIIKKINNNKIINFFNVVANKKQSAEEFLGISIENLNNVKISNQVSNANESLATFKSSLEYFKNNVEEKGKLIAWDLETTGGKNLNGIWQPDSITEFSMQTYDYTTKSLSKINVLVGLEEKEGQQILKEIKEAIHNGTIDTNERLRVSAMRYAKYGDNAFTMARHADGYFYATSFPTDEKNNWKDIEAIEEGINRFIKVGKETAVDSNGIRADKKAIISTINNANAILSSGNASLLGYNDLKHDQPILEAMMMKWRNENEAIKDLFVNGTVGLNISSDQSIDMLGGVKLFTDYNSVKDLYAGKGLAGINKIRGQEFIVQKHLPTLAQNLRAHMAEDDVTALLNLVISSSEITPNGESFLEYISNGLKNVQVNEFDVVPGKHILRAKKGVNQNYDGKNFFNFAHSKSTGEIFTIDNYSIMDDIVTKKNFSAGFGINKGHMYEVLDVSKFSLDDEMRTVLGEISPAHSGQSLYRVQLGMTVHDDHKNRRINDLVQNLVFKSEKEMNAFLSGHFDVVAEMNDDGEIKIVDDMRRYFDRRKLSKKNGKAHLEVLNKEASDAEIFMAQVLANNEKLAVSRADNAMFRDNSYEKIKKALDLKAKIEKELQIDNMPGSQILDIMSERVSKGQMALELDNSQIMKAQDIIAKTLGYNFNNVQHLLQSTIDNNAAGIDMISTHEKMLTCVINTLEGMEGFSDKSPKHKQEVFARVLKQVKMTAAEHTYNNKDTQAMLALGNKRLEASFEEFKNMFEIDYGALIKGDKVDYVSISNPLEYQNILKLDISNKDSAYKLIDSAVEIVHGKDRKKQDAYEVSAMLEMFDMLNRDKDLAGTKAFKDIKKQYKFHKGSFELQHKMNQHEIAESIILSMQELKASNVKHGIINFDHAFMKALEGHTGFGAVLNSDGVVNQIPDIVEKVVKNFTLDEVDDTKNLAERLVKKYYMPDYSVVKNNKKFNKTIDMLYKNLNNDMVENMEDILKSISKIDGTSISIQNNGEIFAFNGGQRFHIGNIPKINFDNASGTLYTELGSMKIQVSNELTFDVEKNGSKVIAGARSSIGFINDYKLSPHVEYDMKNDGVDTAFNTIKYGVNRKAKKIRQMSTINGFGGNDYDANNSVMIDNIKKVLPEIFGEGGNLNYLIENVEFADKDFKDIMKQTMTKYLDSDFDLEDLSPETKRDLIKNVEFLLEIIKDKGLVTDDFKFLSTDIGFTGAEKKVSNLIAVKGYRPSNSTFGVFDNGQRPPVTQSGNALHLREIDIERAKHMNVGVGNVVTNENMENRLVNNYLGIGRTNTDAVMDITYIDTNSLNVLIDNNFSKVMQGNDVTENTKDQIVKTFNFVKSSVSTFEQERVMDSRVHEAVYGLRTAQVQKLSKNYEVNSLLKTLSGKDFEKQAAAILDYKGQIELNGDNLVFNPFHGKIVKRGESAIKWKGFADLESDFASKMQYGVFNYNFYESDGTKLRPEEISRIINESKHLFFDENNQMRTQHEMAGILDQLLYSKGIKGQYAIEDISAMGYVKTMTGAEKGMTNVMYAAVGSQDARVKEFFKEIGAWNMVESKTITDEAIDAIVNADKIKTMEALTNHGFSGVDHLKEVIKNERHSYSNMLFGKILDNSTHVLVNDAVIKHGNVGQMYQGLMSKAINSLTKQYGGDENKAIDYVVDLLNNKEYQFMSNIDFLNNTKSTIKVSNKNARLFLEDNFQTTVNNMSELDFTKFTNFIKAIDSELENLPEDQRLIAKNIYVMNKDGQYEKKDMFVGSFKTTKKTIEVINENGALETINDAKVILGTNSREGVKYVKDSETQSGVTQEFLQLKTLNKNLKMQKINIQTRMNKIDKGSDEYNALNLQLIKINKQLDHVEGHLASYSGAVKAMTVGDQELSILERISITQSHADKINDLILSGEIDNSMFLNSIAFQGKVKVNSDGTLKFSDDVVGSRTLSGFTSEIRKNQLYNRRTEQLLTAEMLKDKKYAHLKDIYDYTSKHDLNLGVDTAQNIYLTTIGDRAAKWNKGFSIEKKYADLFELRDIRDINFDAEDVATKNFLVDLGDKFNNEERYIAMPGLGFKVKDEEVLTEAQSKLYGLQRRIKEIEDLHGETGEKYDRMINGVRKARLETIEAIEKTVHGKHGAAHNLAKIEIDAVSYRLKSSGIIVPEANEDLVKAAEQFGVDLSQAAFYTDKSMINGKSISEWEQAGQAFYKYQYVSKQKMREMGYFDESTLKKFGFLIDGVSLADAEKQMEEFLKTHGTYAVNDRYPNIKNESLNAIRLFLGDESLTGNQTRISVAAMLGPNGDNDGDSHSGFRLEARGKKGEVIDGAMYELAKIRAAEAGVEDVRQFAIDNNIMTGEIFDDFRKVEQGMIVEASTFNGRKWQGELVKKMKEDYIKNQNVANPENMVLLPGGKSVLGQKMFSSIQQMPSLQTFNKLEEEANEILLKAHNITKEAKIKAGELAADAVDDFKPDINSMDSMKALDEALTVLKEHSTEKEMNRYNNIAIRKANVDRYAQELMAKTGLATTGSVNLAMNSVKLAAFYSETSANDVHFTNYIWSALDSAEQDVISSKKSTEKYDDKRIVQFKEAMKQILTGNKRNASVEQGIQGLTTWLDEYGDNLFKKAYNEIGETVLSKEQLEKIALSDNSVEEGAKMMKQVFSNKVREMSTDQLTGSIIASFESIGRNGRNSAMNWWNGSVGAAAAQGKSLAGVAQGVLGYADESQYESAAAKQTQRAKAEKIEQLAKESLSPSSTKQFIQNTEAIVNNSPRVGGLGMMALGVAAGLMVGGYASGNPLNDKSAQQVSEEQTEPQQTMSIPEFMEKESGYVTGNSQQGYIINIRADTKKGKKHIQQVMTKAAEATVGGAVSVNMNIRTLGSKNITDRDIENYINKFF